MYYSVAGTQALGAAARHWNVKILSNLVSVSLLGGDLLKMATDWLGSCDDMSSGHLTSREGD